MSTASERSGHRSELIGVQYLRALAALMVVVFHLEPQLNRMGYTGYWPKGLSGGVDIFFVISGLIMWATTAGRSVKVLEFWKRRLTRIVPLYWAFTIVMVIIMLVAPTLLQSSRFEPFHVIMSFLFLPAHHPIKPSMEPVIIPGWTLNYEMFFYLIFGLWLFAPERWRPVGNAVTICILISIGLIAGYNGRESIVGFYTSTIMLEFLFGIVLGVALTSGRILRATPPALAWAIAIVGLILIITLPAGSSTLPRAITMGIPSLFVVGASLALELRGRIGSWRFMQLLGSASYSLYLSHFFTLSLVFQLSRKLVSDRSANAYICFGVVAVACSVIVGLLCYRLIEKPLTTMLHSSHWGGVRFSVFRRRPSTDDHNHAKF